VTENATRAGCGPDCPCQSVRALGGVWPIFSTGERRTLIELPEYFPPTRVPSRGGVRSFKWGAA
jgi:hypothetical protein